MATALADFFERDDDGAENERGMARDIVSWIAGVAVMALALALALALWSFDPADPSFNHATDAAPSNWLGFFGAQLADVAMQLFGRASWLFVLVFAAWGARWMFGKPLVWPWAPVIALPIAVMALCAYFATLEVPDDGWPLRVGLGGLVGEFEYNRLIVDVGPTMFKAGAFLIAAIASVVALGVRMTEALWLGALCAGSALSLGRKVGAAAGDAAAAGGARLADARARVAGKRRRDDAAFEEEGLGPDEFAYEAARGRRRRRPATLDVEDEEDLYDVRDQAPSPAAVAEQAPDRLDDDYDEAPLLDPDDDVRLAPEGDHDVDQAGEPAPRRRGPGIAVAAQAPQATPPQPAKRRDLKPMPPPRDGFVLPAIGLLGAPKRIGKKATKHELDERSRELETVLDDFGVRGEIVDAKPGPVVTLFELEPAPGTRAARVISLADDVARSLSAHSVRVAVVPGRNVIGIETPNETREMVFLRELMTTPEFADTPARLALALGKDIAGQPMVVDLARMPHLLIAGTTGSGKSVAINAMILSLLYKLTPKQCRLLMIDPKVIELSVYEDIPHLLTPVVTEPHKAVTALKWIVRQMDERYRLMSHLGVRDIYAFNRKLAAAAERGEELTRRVRTGFEAGTGAPIYEEQPIDMTPMPLIVVIVDEVADLMLTAGKEIEGAIQRLSQKARAAGIHLIVATQRPSVDVLTGVIKANLPSRISFRVSGKIDSRTVLGEPGAEQLLGQGDMLYMMPGDRTTRIHGPFVTDGEVEAVVKHLKKQGGPDYLDDVLSEGEEGASGGAVAGLDEASGEHDQQYATAMQIVAADGKASTSYLQRKMSIGYNTAAKLIERMEQDGLISAADHVGRRQVLMGRGGVDGVEETNI